MDRIARVVATLTAKLPTRRVYGPMDKPSDYVALDAHLTKTIGRSSQNRDVVLYEYRGESYSIPQLAVMSGLCAATLRTRIRSGMSIEDVVNKPLDPVVEKRKLSSCKYEWPVGSGRKYNIRQLANVAGVPYNTMYSRIQSGWDINKAMEH